ncbi:short/branched chain specific acyl-CoA dehydrogenase-like protein, partial [Leptotrombidium deliense]
KSGIRNFVATACNRQRHAEQHLDSSLLYAPLSKLSEDEMALKEMVAKLAKDKIEPKVKEMDESSKMHRELIDELFKNGLMAVDVPEKYNGTGANFFSAVLVIEELAKVDPSISVLCDVQHTLVFPIFMRYGNEEQRQKYLPR